MAALALTPVFYQALGGRKTRVRGRRGGGWCADCFQTLSEK